MNSHPWTFLSLLSLISSYCFTRMVFKSEIHGKNPAELLTTDTTAKLQGVKPQVHTSQLMQFLSDIWSCAKMETSKLNWLWKGVANVKVCCFLREVWPIVFLPVLPSPIILFLISILWRSLWWFCPTFALHCPAKIMLLFTYFRSLQTWIPPQNNW